MCAEVGVETGAVAETETGVEGQVSAIKQQKESTTTGGIQMQVEIVDLVANAINPTECCMMANHDILMLDA